MDIYNNHIFLNLRGTTKGTLLSSSHGYYAYVSTGDAFIYELFKSLSLWNGSTNNYETRSGYYYNQFELSCKDKPFFKSESFKIICERHNIRLTIYDDYDDNDVWFDFWDQMRR